MKTTPPTAAAGATSEASAVADPDDAASSTIITVLFTAAQLGGTELSHDEHVITKDMPGSWELMPPMPVSVTFSGP